MLLLLVSLQLFDWSKSDSNERLLTFYRLCDRVAERLKGLFVLFAGNLVKPFADLLRQTNSSKTGDVFHLELNFLLLPSAFKEFCLLKICSVSLCFLSGDLLFDSSRSDEKSSLLLRFILDCLHKIFLYDTQMFLSKERADALMSPLTDQVRAQVEPLTLFQPVSSRPRQEPISVANDIRGPFHKAGLVKSPSLFTLK